jgi:hypothetical protein
MRSWAERARSLAPLAAIVVAVFACTEAETEDGETEDGDDEKPTYASLDARPCPEDSFISYEDFGGPFLITWCNGCHASGLPEGERQDAPLGVDFDTIEQIRSQAARIWARSGDHNATMPPVGGPDEEDRARLGEWLACGAPLSGELDADP